MKKAIIAVMALCLSVSFLTACGNKNNSGSGSQTSASETTSSSEMASDSQSESESGSDMAGSEGMLTSSLSSIGDKIEQVGEWTTMDTIDDASILMENMGLDMSNENYRNIYVRKAMMSAAFGEYIIIEADDVDAAVKDLEARRDKLIETDTFYPEHRELAEQTIVGKKGNYAYLIARENPGEVETELLNQLP